MLLDGLKRRTEEPPYGGAPKTATAGMRLKSVRFRIVYRSNVTITLQFSFVNSG